MIGEKLEGIVKRKEVEDLYQICRRRSTPGIEFYFLCFSMKTFNEEG